MLHVATSSTHCSKIPPSLGQNDIHENPILGSDILYSQTGTSSVPWKSLENIFSRIRIQVLMCIRGQEVKVIPGCKVRFSRRCGMHQGERCKLEDHRNSKLQGQKCTLNIPRFYSQMKEDHPIRFHSYLLCYNKEDTERMSNVFVSTCVVILSSYHPMFFAFTKEGEQSREGIYG